MEASDAPVLLEHWFTRAYKDGIVLCGTAINHPKRPEKPFWSMTTSRVLEILNGEGLTRCAWGEICKGDTVRTRGSVYVLGEPLGLLDLGLPDGWSGATPDRPFEG